MTTNTNPTAVGLAVAERWESVKSRDWVTDPIGHGIGRAGDASEREA